MTQTQKQAVSKIVELLEEEQSFAVLPMEEYEDLLMKSDPNFWIGLEESRQDMKAGRLTRIDEVEAELNL